MTQPGGLPPRRHKRHPLPTTLAVVSADFQAPDGGTLLGQLWDLSSAGVCLQIRGHAFLAEDSIGPLRILDPFKPEKLSVTVQVRWSTPSRHVTFVGMLFADGLLNPGTFLDDYMKASWVDQMQTYREDGFFF
jgi:hypothetical protein